MLRKKKKREQKKRKPLKRDDDSGWNLKSYKMSTQHNIVLYTTYNI